MKTSKNVRFGEKFVCAPGDKCEFLMRKAKELNLNVKGVAFHIGLGFFEADMLAKAIKVSTDTFEYGNSLGLEMEVSDICGGFDGREAKTFVIKTSSASQHL